uniref:PDZ domain-containing protein n=1 Tax=Electrophorus electricus TaxID=8005 RepID=A0AAY5ELK8_ELEEL
MSVFRDVFMDVNVPLFLRVMLIRRKGESLGISIIGGNDTGIFVSEIMKGGVVALDGRLLPGDQILSLLAVNGRSLQGVTHTEAIAILRQAGSRVTLTILSPTPTTRMANMFVIRKFHQLCEELKGFTAVQALECYFIHGPKCFLQLTSFSMTPDNKNK